MVCRLSRISEGEGIVRSFVRAHLLARALTQLGLSRAVTGFGIARVFMGAAEQHVASLVRLDAREARAARACLDQHVAAETLAGHAGYDLRRLSRIARELDVVLHQLRV